MTVSTSWLVYLIVLQEVVPDLVDRRFEKEYLIFLTEVFDSVQPGYQWNLNYLIYFKILSLVLITIFSHLFSFISHWFSFHHIPKFPILSTRNLLCCCELFLNLNLQCFFPFVLFYFHLYLNLNSRRPPSLETIFFGQTTKFFPKVLFLGK